MPNYPFQQVAVDLDFHRGHVVHWKFADSFRPAPPTTITLEICEDPDFLGPIETVVATSFYAVDSTRSKQDWVVPRYYRLKVVDGNGKQLVSDTFDFNLAQLPRHKYLLISEMLRKEWLRMQYVGQQGYLLKRRYNGVNATQDVDPVTGVPISNNALSSGVGLEHGYYPPVSLIFSSESHEQQTKLDETGLGVNFNEHLDIRVANFPSINVQDVLVANTGKRWFVFDVQEKLFPGTSAVLIQSVKCRIIPNTDPVYNIAVS